MHIDVNSTPSVGGNKSYSILNGFLATAAKHRYHVYHACANA